MQPDRLRELPRLESDGMMQRYLPLVMAEGLDERDEPVDEAVEKGLDALLDGLEAIPPDTQFRFDAAASALYLDFAHDMKKGSRFRHPTPDFGTFIGKQARTLGVLALLLHAVEVAEGRAAVVDEVPLATVEWARKLTLWLIQHARQFYAMRSEQATRDLQAIAHALVKHGGEYVTASTLAWACRALRGQPLTEVQKALAVFEVNCWVVPGDISPVNNRWSVNPGLKGRFEEEIKARTAELKEISERILGDTK